MSKILVVDSSSLISLSEKCFMQILGRLVTQNNWQLVIPKEVLSESVTRPLHISRFELNALRIELAVEATWLEVVESNPQIENWTSQILSHANHCFTVDDQPLEIVQRGEAQALALAKYLNAQVMVVDERTTRLLIEKPKLLEWFIKERHPKAKTDETHLMEIQKMFPSLAVARSTELMALAYEQGLLSAELGDRKEALEGTLNALKFAGCAVSQTEIAQFLSELSNHENRNHYH